MADESFCKHNLKMAMLNHEHTFRHQVYELHRLYRIQKVLMKNIAENRGKTEEEEGEEGEEIEFIQESEIQLTLGPSSYSNQVGGRRRRRKKLGELMKGGSDSSSCSTTGSAPKSGILYRDGEFLGFLDLQDETRLAQHHPNPWLCQVVSLNLT
ncbi:uncharacterized protein LOC111483758 [Cucurbita maxima]|uniref:Uncharacterized protein LOC111483758 n=1 Tax=Cucurbita maxima TaxID=3661 RepID=A0A6J1J5Z3_CUCMA|nr:uncharacterized protein LOC111483758 [Cucurbita maxima]